MNLLPGPLAYKGYQFIWEILDWVYPPDCGGCGQKGTRWCIDCSQSIIKIEPPICPICGNPNNNGELCLRCKSSKPFYTSMRSYAVYQGSIREAIHKLKYNHRMGLGEALARMMISSLEMLNWSLDIITSVPLGLVRFEERGYNQATLLAKPIALSQRLPFSPRILVRRRETRSQVGLTVLERQENMAGAFWADSKLAKGKNILIVDDVTTSGATINSCAKALIDAGASSVYGFSLARAVNSSGQHIDM